MNNSDPNSTIVTKDELDRATQRMDLLMAGVIVVLFLGFVSIILVAIGFGIDAWRFKSETYQNLVNQVNAQSTKIDTLTITVQQAQIQANQNK